MQQLEFSAAFFGTSSRLAQVANLAAAISFSIHFPIKGFIKSTKRRQFTFSDFCF
jgi:hypothetical protein